MPTNAWVFDLDGTLTVPQHDFAAMRRRLGITEGIGIVDALLEMTPQERAAAEVVIQAWEAEHAETAVCAPGARSLLEALASSGVAVGVLTRNTRPLALRTLEVIGLDRWIDSAHVLGRHDATPKPDPAGIATLTAAWGVQASRVVMVGDHLADVQAGRRAGAQTVHVGPARVDWSPWIDLHVDALTALLPNRWRTLEVANP